MFSHRHGSCFLASLIFFPMMGVFYVGFVLEPVEYISEFMSTGVIRWIAAMAIATLARMRFFGSDHWSTTLLLQIYFVAWLGVIVTAPVGGPAHDFTAPIAMCVAGVESYFLYVRRLQRLICERMITAVLIAALIATYYAIYQSGQRTAAIMAEYTCFLAHIFMDSWGTLRLRRDRVSTADPEAPLADSTREVPVQRLDWAVLAPLGAMYLSSLARFYLKEPDALVSWQVPHFSMLLAGAHMAKVEFGTWAFAALMSLLAKVEPPTGHEKIPMLHWIVPFMVAWGAVLWKSQQHVAGAAGDIQYLASCAALVAAAVQLSTIGTRVVSVHPAVLTAACVGAWCSVKVLGDTLAPEAWLTSVIWPLGEHCLLLGLLVLNSAMPAKLPKNDIGQLPEGSELAHVILC